MAIKVSRAEENSATVNLEEPVRKLKVAESLKSDMAIWDKYQEELRDAEENLKEVEEKLPSTGIN
jgi:hypothetical protein